MSKKPVEPIVEETPVPNPITKTVPEVKEPSEPESEVVETTVEVTPEPVYIPDIPAQIEDVLTPREELGFIPLHKRNKIRQ